MKKVTYLLLLMFATLLLTTSCDEDEPLTKKGDEGIIILSELDGQWNFQSYLFNDNEITLANYYIYGADYDGIENTFLNWEFNVGNMKAIRTSPLYPNDYGVYDFTKTINIINIEERIYTIISYDGNELKMRLEDVPYDFDFDGGILTLTK